MESRVPPGLSAAHEQVRAELGRADTKATTLLSLVGAAFAGVVALSGRAMPGAGSVLLWVSLVPIFASVVVLLTAIRPRLTRVPVPGSWLYAAGVGPATLLESFGPAEPTSVATHVCVLARYAQVKYRRITAALVLLAVGLLSLLGSVLVTAVVS